MVPILPRMTPGLLRGPAIAADAMTSAADQTPESLVADIPLSKKQLKRLLDGARPLDAWERYRALNDAIDEAYDLIDVSNREARFALLLLGGLNALILLAASRSDLVGALDARQRLWTGILLGVFAVAAVYFVLEAIQALRSRPFRPRLET